LFPSIPAQSDRTNGSRQFQLSGLAIWRANHVFVSYQS
jgi:hypothetical protein